MEELRVEIRASMVLLACAVAFIGTHAAISMGEQFRLALSVPTTTYKKYAMLALVALSLGGVGFSGTQYVVFQSFRLRTSDNTIVAIGYDPDMVLGSALVASFITFLGLCLASTDECFNKSQKDIMEIFIKRTSRTYSIGEIKRLGKWHILFLVCTSSLHRVLTGGFLVGGGLCLARYMAVISVQFPGKVIYHDGMLSLAIILSIVGITILFWLFFRVLSVFPSMDILRTICSLLGLAVIACVQYIRLIFVTFNYDSNTILPENTVKSSVVIVSVLTSAVLLCFLVLAYVLSDLRAWLQRTTIQLRQADRALISMLNRNNKNSQNRTPPTSTNTESNQQQQRQQQYQQLKYRNVPSEVVNYTRKYLNPDRMPELIAHQKSRSLEGGGNVFIQSPAIYYDTDIPAGGDIDIVDGGGVDTTTAAEIVKNNESENNELTYSQYQEQHNINTHINNNDNNNNIESNIEFEMSSAMMEEGISHIEDDDDFIGGNSSTRSNSGMMMNSPYPDKETNIENNGIMGIALTSSSRSIVSNHSNRIYPTTTPATITTPTSLIQRLPPLIDKYEDEEYEDADINNKSISAVRKMSGISDA